MSETLMTNPDEDMGPKSGKEKFRNFLGRLVREAWVRWALTQPSPKPSWIEPWENLAEPDKEADRQIGEAIYAGAQEMLSAANANIAELESFKSAATLLGIESINVSNPCERWMLRNKRADAMEQQNLELAAKAEKLTGYLAHEATLNLELEATVEKMREALSAQHRWHLHQTDRTPIMFGDTIGIIPADEYSDCEMCDKTMAALSLAPSSALLAHDLEVAERAFPEGFQAGKNYLRWDDDCHAAFLVSQTRRAIMEGKEKA